MAKSAGTVSARTVRSREVLCLMRMEQMLDELTPGQQARILRYFADRYVYDAPGTEGVVTELVPRETGNTEQRSPRNDAD